MRWKNSPDPSNDRLWPALLGAVLIHVGLVVLVDWDGFTPSSAPSMDVVWVPTVPEPLAPAPEAPDFLANANQTGGQENESDQASEPPSGRADRPDAATPDAQTPSQARVDEDADEPGRVLDLSGALPSRDNKDWAHSAQRLEADPRHKRINASTREHRFAAYMAAWTQKIERVGRLHYPQEARRRGLSGSLVLSVELLPSGQVDEVIIERSSGHPFLDEAAREIVAMASPFAPLPIEPGELDRLTITRTWQFSSGGAFR